MVDVEKKNKQIDELRANIDTTILAERDLETKIYKMSGENMLKINEKDSLIMLIPDIILALRHEPNELKANVNSLSDKDVMKNIKSILSKVLGN